MARRIWIISEETEITQEVIDEATANNCPEIASGIPPALEGIVFEEELPTAYEEPNIPIVPLPHAYSSHLGIVEAIDMESSRPVRVNVFIGDSLYMHDCFITEWVAEYYIQGHKLEVGDYVTVKFIENHQVLPIVTEKMWGDWNTFNGVNLL